TLRVLALRGVGRREQAPLKPRIVEFLSQLEDPLPKRRRSKKSADAGGRILVANFRVVSAIRLQELLVIAQERRGIGPALVPYENTPAVRLEDADEFLPCFVAFKPVRRLGRCDKIDAAIRQRRGFCPPGNAYQFRKRRQQSLTRFAHFRIGLDRENAISILEQMPCPQARPRGHIRDQRLRREVALSLEQSHDFG